MFGFILTNAKDYKEVKAYADKFGVDTIKIVPTWGIPWDKDYNRIRILRGFKNVIVRTPNGDPLSGKPYLHWEEVVAYIKPFYRYRRDIIIQLGNEPNNGFIDPYGYAYHYQLTIDACKREFPLAKLISAPLQQRNKNDIWNTALFECTMQCDYTGIHLYEDFTFIGSVREQETINQYPLDLYPPLFICEAGINVPKLTRINEYRLLETRYGNAVWYHMVADKKIDGQYHL